MSQSTYEPSSDAEILPSGHPSIIDESQAEGYLDRMGIRLEILTDALDAGETAAQNTTKYAPKTGTGMRRWIAIVEGARQSLVEDEWTLDDALNRPTATSPDERLRLSFVGGDEQVGNTDPNAMPKAASPRGPATEQAHHQLTLDIPLKTSSASNQAAPSDMPPEGEWVFLYHRADDEIRSEVSLPLGFKNGQFTGWRVRIVLPSIPLGNVRAVPNDIGGGDVGFKVEEIR